MKARIEFIIVILLTGIILFAHLGGIPLQLWDESRTAINTMEMAHNFNVLVPTIDGHPDMWNTKPPLLIWIQSLSLALLGISEVSLRLPSAIAALITCIAIFNFLRKHNTSQAGVISIMVLVTSAGYVTIHGTRTADYDSLLTLFITVYILQFYLYVEEGKKKHLFTTLIFIILASLTKGIAGIIPTVPLFIYCLYRRKVGSILKDETFYIGLFCFMLIIGGYYLLAEHYVPGHFSAVVENELGGRFLKTNEENIGGHLYYVRNLFTYQYSYWIAFFITGCAYFIFYQRANHRRLAVYLIIIITVFFTIINISRTKLEWYIMPLFPMMAMVTGLFVHELILIISKKFKPGPGIAYTVIIAINIFPVYKALSRSFHPATMITGNHDANELAAFLSNELKHKSITPLKVAWNEYQGPLSFYMLAFKERGMPIEKANIDQLHPNERVILYEPEVKKEIDKMYRTEMVSRGKYTSTILILGRLQQ